MGGDNDPMAVLDSRFRVRNTRGLRVVDASVFPKIPGYFIVTPIYMISEKAAAVIMEDAKC
jgi:choline dehydrogenase